MHKTDETSIRLDVINFCAAVSRDKNCDSSCADQLLAIIERGISDSFYKIVSESFRVLSLLVAKVSVIFFMGGSSESYICSLTRIKLFGWKCDF